MYGFTVLLFLVVIRRIITDVESEQRWTQKKWSGLSWEGTKDKIAKDEQAGVVCTIGCKNWENIYVGETARTAKMRAKEHNIHARTGNTHLLAAAAAAYTKLGHDI